MRRRSRATSTCCCWPTLEDGPRHGYAVKEALREGSGGRFDLPTGTIYPALHRLEEAGLIAGSWSTVDGRRRRTYQLTAAGRAAAARRPQQLARVRRRHHRPAGAQAMASHQLIDAYLAALARRLPADTVDELADGLTETWQHHLDAGPRQLSEPRTPPSPSSAGADQITDAFVVQAPGPAHRPAAAGHRPAHRCLLGRHPHRRQGVDLADPRAAAARLRRHAAGRRRRADRRGDQPAQLPPHPPRHAGALALVVLDVAMIAAVACLAPTLVWPMAIAIPASLARIGLVLQLMPRRRTA